MNKEYTTIAQMPPKEAYDKLISIGENEEAQKLLPAINKSSAQQKAGKYAFFDLFGSRPWQYTEHAYGYIAAGGEPLLNIRNAGSIPFDISLKGARITITLDRLNVADYPGSGVHNVLFDFYGENHLEESIEKIHFNILCRAYEGQAAAIVNYPIFVGLRIGDPGLVFKCSTINVKNDDDEKFLGFLESDEFKSGFKLINSLQPAIVPFSQTIQSLTKSIAKRNRNIVVQEFFMGLDFSDIPTGLRLATGSYIVAQVPQSLQHTWDWAQWKYDAVSGRIVNVVDKSTPFDFNYLIFGIKRL